MKIFRNINELKEEIIKTVELYGINIISVDGKDGCGKSTLANLLCESTKYIHLNIDDDKYLIKEQGTYVDYIKYDNLEKKIKNNLNNNNVIIIDGICVLKILDNLKRKSELKIYIKRLSYYSFWYDGKDFDYAREVEEILQENEESLKSFIQIEAKLENISESKYEYKESISHEIIKYHHEYKPDENADLIFERIQNAG